MNSIIYYSLQYKRSTIDSLWLQ